MVGAESTGTTNFGHEDKQQSRLPVTEKIARAALVLTAILLGRGVTGNTARFEREDGIACVGSNPTAPANLGLVYVLSTLPGLGRRRCIKSRS